ncbi:MAG: SMI1/KNR4 family protein [Holosporales bacterium]|jgi:hypothetical protein|nr:SMI1/KNR4 family protein [Holosporales bacterium]
MNKTDDSGMSKNLIEFTIDNFGTLLCFERNENKILFYQHENGATEKIAPSFTAFLSKFCEIK